MLHAVSSPIHASSAASVTGYCLAHHHIANIQCLSGNFDFEKKLSFLMDLVVLQMEHLQQTPSEPADALARSTIATPHLHNRSNYRQKYSICMLLSSPDTIACISKETMCSEICNDTWCTTIYYRSNNVKTGCCGSSHSKYSTKKMNA